MPPSLRSAQAASGWSVRRHLSLFSLVLALPILALVGALLWQFATSERARVEAEALAKARNMALAVDRELGGLTASLNVLASSPALRQGDFEAFYRQAAEVRGRTGYWVILRDRLTGQQLVNTRLPWGTPLPKSNIPELSADELHSGRPIISDLFQGAVVKSPIVAVQLPVERNGAVPYILSLPFSADVIRDLILAEEPAPQWTVSVVDRTETVIARNRRHEESVGQRATQSYIDGTQGREGFWNGATLESAPVFGAYARSRLSDWKIGLGIPTAELNAPIWRSVGWFIAIGAGILGLSTLLAFLFGRRITGPIQALAERAAALGRGEPVEPLRTALHEANQVGNELAAASAMRREREAELRGNEALKGAMLESALDCVITINHESRVVEWNPAAERTFGYSRDKALGEDLAELIIPPEFRDRHHRGIAHYLATGQGPVLGV